MKLSTRGRRRKCWNLL